MTWRINVSRYPRQRHYSQTRIIVYLKYIPPTVDWLSGADNAVTEPRGGILLQL